MAFFNDDFPEDIEATSLLNEEASELASKLGKSFQASSALSSLAPSMLSPSESQTEPNGPTEPSPLVGGRVWITYNGQNYSFILGRETPPELPKAAFEAIPSMKKGEKISLSVSSSTSLDSTTHQVAKDIDTSSSQQLDTSTSPSRILELKDFEEIEHVAKGGSIVKRRLYCPEETKDDKHTPVFETTVVVNLKGRLEEDDKDKFFDSREHFSFRVGEGEVPLGLERAIRTMHRGEKAEFVFLPPWTSKMVEEKKGEFSSGAVVYIVELESFKDAKSPFECKTNEENVKEALLRKEQGNAAHEAKNFALAITKYTKAQLYLELVKDVEGQEEHDLNALKVLLWLNLAACNLKLESYEKVKLHCTSALEIDPKNVKGLYRRASACVALNLWDDAYKDVTLLLEIDPQNSLAKHLLSRIQHKFKADSIEQQQTYRRIFEKLESPNEKPLYHDVKPSTSSSNEKKNSTNNPYIFLALAVLLIIILAIINILM